MSKNKNFSYIGGIILKIRLLKFVNKKVAKRIFSRIFSINGLVLTILLGLVINVSSSMIQEIINKQRYLELLQWEITNNMIFTGNIFDDFADDGIVYNSRLYSSLVYEAGLNNGYLFTLNPDTLISITGYYDIVINNINSLSSEYIENESYHRKQWHDCIFSHTGDIDNLNVCEKEEITYDESTSFYSEQQFKNAEVVFNNSSEILNEFRPTNKRLNSIFLKLFMGDEAIEILK